MNYLGNYFKTIYQRIKEMRLWEIGAMILFTINMSGIFYFNLSDLRLSLDPDFATVVYHLREIVNKGSLVLPNWVATTSMEFDSTLLFAVPFYALTGNEFLSVGLSDLLIVFIYIYAIWNILTVLHVRIGVRFLTLAVIITPYNYDWLDYFKMLFFAHANYSIKALVPIMLVLCLIAFDDGKFADCFSKWKRISFLFIYLSLLFVTCASTGIYTVVCGVVPILFINVFSLWKKRYAFKESVFPVWAMSGIFATMGIFTYKLIYTGHSPSSSFIKIENFWDNMKDVFVGVFQAFGILFTGSVPLFSKMGLFYLLKIAFVIAMFIVTALVIYKWLRGADNYNYYVSFFSVILFNMLILIVCDMRAGNNFIPYRYLFVGIPILLTGMGIMLNRYLATHNNKQIMPIMSLVLLACSYMLVGNFKVTNDNLMDKDYIVDMTDYFSTLDVDTVFIADDKDTALMCKAVDDSKNYACYNSEDESITLEINYYKDEKDFDYYGDKNVIAIPYYNKLTDYVPEHIADEYEYVGETRWLACYVSDTNFFKDGEKNS